MPCEHILKIVKKMNDLVEPNKPFARTAPRFQEWAPCGLGERWYQEQIKSANEYITNQPASITIDNLRKHFLELTELMEKCNCRNELIDEYNELVRNSVSKGDYNELFEKSKKDIADYNKLLERFKNLSDKYDDLVNKFNNLSENSVKDYNVLKDKYNKLVDDYNDKNADYHEYKEKYDDAKEELHSEKLKHANESGNEKLKHSSEKSQLQIQNTKLQEKLEAANSEKIDLRSRLKDKEGENNRLLIKLDDKNNQLTILRLESGEKDSKLQEQAEEIKRLKKNLGTTQREAVDEKLQFKQEKLETLATQLGVQLRRIETLRRRFKELIIAQENNNNNNVNAVQDNITAIKETLQGGGVSINNVQRICKKCRKLAQLELQLEQVRQQQYEARQEVPPHNNYN